VRELLTDLNRVSGVRGSLLATRDGMVVAGDVDAGIDADRIAAMAATLAVRTGECLQKMGRGQLVLAMLNAAEGKVFIGDAGKGILVVVTSPQVNVGLVRLEIRAAAERFAKR
jgi:predicted regulator of Ras-like GTPase activity (Roadblock/LC7/MglB family)